MPDPRLRSNHLLDWPARREDYRNARESLLRARGCLTHAGVQGLARGVAEGKPRDWRTSAAF